MAAMALRSWARAGKSRPDHGLTPTYFAPVKPPPSVAPADAKMAMDASSPMLSWANNAMIGAAVEGQTFLGYPILAQLAQRAEYRIISETIAGDMTSKWIEVQATGEMNKAERIDLINRALVRLNAKAVFKKALEHDGFFGRGQVFIDFGENAPGEPELTHSIGTGRDAASRLKVKGKPIKAIKNVEPTWVYPAQYNASNPLADDFFRPQEWFVMGTRVHDSRLLTIIGRPVPDLLKPAYAFGGLSLSQMAMPYVDNFLRTRQSVSDLVNAFSVMVLKTNLSQAAAMGFGSQIDRIETFNDLRDNRGLMVLDKELEDFANVSAPISGLDHIQAQSLEHISCVSRLPLVKFTGISPSGLNASSDGELRVYYDLILSEQEARLRPVLQKLIDLIQLSEIGDVDETITFRFVPLYTISEAEAAQVRKTDAETDVVLIDGGIISPEEARKRISADPDTAYPGLDPEDMPASVDDGQDTEDNPLAAMFGGSGGGAGDHDQDNVGGFAGADRIDADKPAKRFDA